MSLPLEGVKIIEFGRIFSAPYCSMMLSDLGAEIIKIEKPNNGDEARSFGPPFVDGLSCYFISLNRNKKSLTLNLNTVEGKEILNKLLNKADVFIHNTLPITIDKLGFSYEKIKLNNPRLIYCAINGFGYASPFCNVPSQDIIAQSISGIMSITGFDNNPPTRAGLPITDAFSGMIAAYSILAALFQRVNTQKGQLISTSLLEAALSLTSYVSASFFSNQTTPVKTGNAHASIVPYNVFKTSDGWITLAISNQEMWTRFCNSIGFSELLNNEKFKTNKDRVENRIELEEIIKLRMLKSTSSKLVEILKRNNVICSKVNDFKEVFECDEVTELNMRVSTKHHKLGVIEYIGSPANFSEFKVKDNTPPPLLGEHNNEILLNLGYNEKEIDLFIKNGVI